MDLQSPSPGCSVLMRLRSKDLGVTNDTPHSLEVTGIAVTSASSGMLVAGRPSLLDWG